MNRRLTLTKLYKRGGMAVFLFPGLLLLLLWGYMSPFQRFCSHLGEDCYLVCYGKDDCSVITGEGRMLLEAGELRVQQGNKYIAVERRWLSCEGDSVGRQTEYLLLLKTGKPQRFTANSIMLLDSISHEYGITLRQSWSTPGFLGSFNILRNGSQ